MLLAKQGWRVDVFERFAPLVDEQGNVQASIGPRSYNILLSERAISAMEAAGADISSGFDVPPLQVSLRHKLRGGPADGRSAGIPGRLKIANRGVLAGALVRTCLAQHSGSVQFHFEQELHLFDPATGVAFFRPVGAAARGEAMASSSTASMDAGDAPSSGDGGAAQQQAPPEALTAERTPSSPDNLVSCSFDMLIGADGANSLVRRILERGDSELQCRQTRDVMEFRTCVLGSADEFLPAGSPKEGTFQTWNNAKLQATLIGSSTNDGQLRCVFILPAGEHAKFKSAADYEAYLRQNFPSLPEDAVKRAAPQLLESPISNGGTLTRCSKLASRRVVLIGDAAHSVYPALGQGANAALEGARVLADTLQEVGTGDIEAALAEYSRCWLPSAHAVVELTEEGFGGNRRAFTLNLKLVQLIAQMLLHKLLPFAVPKPAFFQLNSTNISYAEILQRSRRELVVFKAVLAAAAAAAAAALWRSAARPALAALGWA
ncbi:kynurenine 3-monooxygenase [Chlorella sorokiniana]|uniref:Kynurenine 3-monooxygenase n=1 Tax=Chlorella sorokiniana TaxID=3076 RepID=A0A2P6TXT8_CHLSO|nr:kynurenine 3-monooxygenase [Chlorella sorokiniana]|eukprot:PRW58870.1 kynurenine 3-monooxygenase [Chlorella sorokiniana]